jgi:hypothetical protein
MEEQLFLLPLLDLTFLGICPGHHLIVLGVRTVDVAVEKKLT